MLTSFPPLTSLASYPRPLNTPSVCFSRELDGLRSLAGLKLYLLSRSYREDYTR
jgi:hypothetical protein